jgi:hypothetical protein
MQCSACALLLETLCTINLCVNYFEENVTFWMILVHTGGEVDGCAESGGWVQVLSCNGTYPFRSELIAEDDEITALQLLGVTSLCLVEWYVTDTNI